MELGRTSDPRALVPGSPDAIEDNAAKLRAHKDRIEQVGQDLKKIDITGWSGKASDTFWEAFSKEPVRWLKSSDKIDIVVATIIRYGEALRWAQSQARKAIALWEEGEANSARGHQYAPQAAAGGPASSVVDPGEAKRREAHETLTRARAQLEEAGKQATGKISQGALADMIDAMTEGMAVSGKAGASGPNASSSVSGPAGKGQLGNVHALAELGRASAQGKVGNEVINAQGKVEVNAAATSSASASYTNTGVDANAAASVGAKATAEAGANAGPIGAAGKTEGFAGAKTSASGHAGLDGVSGEVGAFAGARAEAAGGADVGGIGISGSAEGWAGAGAEASFDVGYENGKYELETNAGVALGLGADAGFKVTFDPDKVAETTGGAVSAVGDAASSTSQTISGWLE